MSIAPAVNTPNALPRGTRLHEYEIKRVLGVGGFGIVYLAVDLALEREVAIKEYMPASLAGRTASLAVSVHSQSDSDSFASGLRSFVNEARLLARFDDRSLVKVHHYWQANNTAYMVMPYYNGGNLKQMRLALGQAPEEAWLQSLLMALLGAIERLHREDIYHRDISPDNIIIEPDGRPVLLDFGAARRVLGDMSMTLTAILKPAYAPIEQYAETGSVKQGPWTDLYALGATVYFLLLGRPPAPSTTRTVHDDQPTLADQVQDNPVLAAYSSRFLATIDWMLQPRPDARPRSVAQVREALLGQLDPPPQRRADVRREPVWEPTRVEPGRVAAIAPTVVDLAQLKPPPAPRAKPLEQPTVWMSRPPSRAAVQPPVLAAAPAAAPMAPAGPTAVNPHAPEPWIPTMAIPRRAASPPPAAEGPVDDRPNDPHFGEPLDAVSAAADELPTVAPAPSADLEVAAADAEMRADTAPPRGVRPAATAPVQRRSALALFGIGGGLVVAVIGLWLLLRGGGDPATMPAKAVISAAPAPAATSSAAEAARATAASLLDSPAGGQANLPVAVPVQVPAPAVDPPAAVLAPVVRPAPTAGAINHPPTPANRAKPVTPNTATTGAATTPAPSHKPAGAKPAAPSAVVAPGGGTLPARAGLVPGASMVATPPPATPATTAAGGAAPTAAAAPTPASAAARPAPTNAEPEMVLRSRSLGPVERCEGRGGAATRNCIETQCRNAPELREHPECVRLRRDSGASEPR